VRRGPRLVGTAGVHVCSPPAPHVQVWGALQWRYKCVADAGFCDELRWLVRAPEAPQWSWMCLCLCVRFDVAVRILVLLL
jgi:hypothetical protein